MIFTFWSEGANAAAELDVDGWRAVCPNFAVHTCADARAVLGDYGFDRMGLYDRIRLPACRSDIARLALLYEFGGFYVDAHTGVGETHRLLATIGSLARHEVVLYEKTWERTEEQPLRIVNGAIAARRWSPIVRATLESAFHGLVEQYKAERDADAYVPYNISALTGPWRLIVSVFDVHAPGHPIRPGLEGKVDVVRMAHNADGGIAFYKNYSYRKPGQHWSERQLTERLFA